MGEDGEEGASGDNQQQEQQSGGQEMQQEAKAAAPGASSANATSNGYPQGTEYTPDEDGTRYACHSIDFTSMYRPEDFAGKFTEKMAFKSADMAYEDARELFLKSYSFLLPKDVDSMYRFVIYNKVQDYKVAFPEEKLQQCKISCQQFVKLGYIFYKFAEIQKDPRRALFFYVDNGYNGNVDYKELKKLLKMHYNIDAKNSLTLFKVVSAKHGVLPYKKYLQLCEYFDKAYLTDDLMFLFQDPRDDAHQAVCLDRDVVENDDNFSDLSNHRVR